MMTHKCIGGNFDFLLSHLDCKTFTYQDISNWVNNEKPEEYIVQIVPPGFSDSIDILIETDKVNILKVDNKNLQLIDGIYCFKVNNCGTLYSRYEGVACKLKCKLNYLISQADINNIKDFNEIEEVRFLLNGFYENAKLNKPDKALKFFNLAEDKLSCAKCNC